MYHKDIRLVEAHNALDEAYDVVKKERAKQAFHNGILWVVYKLHEGMLLEEIIKKAVAECELDRDKHGI